MTENPRILELRRRVQADPASIAFAQLAEECRRSGANDEAVGICRAGLAHHPDYLSARVTLGRALVEIGKLDDAHTELTIVLTTAPDNLPAIRAMAEIYQRRGQMGEALEHYRRALQLARHDPDLEHAVERIEKEVATPVTTPAAVSASPVAIEALFDFDTLLEQLGPNLPAAPPPSPVLAVMPPAANALDAVLLPEDDVDPFAALERQIRDAEEQRTLNEPPLTLDEPAWTRDEWTREQARRLDELARARNEEARARDEQQAREAERELREAEQQAREAEQRARDEAERFAKEAAERRAREEAEEHARQEAEQQAEEAERQAREAEEQAREVERQTGEVEAERQRLLALQELEEWLSAIAVDRQQQRSA